MRGITVQLKVRTKGTTDAFGQPTFTEKFVNVSDVLVGEPSTADIENNLTRYGKITSYTLAIPKGDTHIWEDTEVVLPNPFSGTYKTIGKATAGIEENIPLRWNKKVHLEAIEG